MRTALVAVAVLSLAGAARADDAFDRFATRVAATDKSTADKLDALNYAMRGRVLSGREQWASKYALGPTPTAAAMLWYLSDYSKPPIPCMNGWIQPAGLPDSAVPIYAPDGFGGGRVMGWFVPAPAPQWSFGPRDGKSRSTGLLYTMPNPLMFPLKPYIIPGSLPEPAKP